MIARWVYGWKPSQMCDDVSRQDLPLSNRSFPVLFFLAACLSVPQCNNSEGFPSLVDHRITALEPK